MSNIQSIERVSKLLGLFSMSRPRLGIAEISRELGLAKGTIQGLVRTLTNEGFLLQDRETKKYQLGYKIYELGVIFGRSLDINQKAVLRVDEIAKKESLTVRVGIWDKDSVLITLTSLAKIGSAPAGEFRIRVPGYATGLGKVLLAFLNEEDRKCYIEQTEFNAYTPNTIVDKSLLLEELELIRKNGYSINREEHWLHRAAIGAPIFGRQGLIVAAISIVGGPSRILGDEKERLIVKITEAAAEISEHMGFSYDMHNKKT